ncbi:hypothetical protein EDD85DRAFT_1021864 [Armillaria nabsnona]|nr:hypothetical protein EDD85DRAFT_1021864 [Armillaria nabsnona]
MILVPSRGQCIQITDNSYHCQCQWFFPPESSLLDQNICGLCGHGIHAHVDYVSTVVNHCPANQCAAYAQKTTLTQRCTCEAQFCEHVAADNLHRILDPWAVLDYFNPDINGPSSSAPTSSYSNDANSPFSPNTMSSDYHTAVLSRDTRNISPTPFTPSPSTASTSSAVQPDTAQTVGYSSDGYFAQYPNYFVSSPYVGPSEGDATNESFEYQDYRNAMYAEPPEAEGWSGSYGA